MNPPKSRNERPTRPLRGSNHTGIRQYNERTVLQAIRQHGAIPKADLARATQLSTQAVSLIVDRLFEDDLLVKQPRVRGRIGQPSVPLSLNPQGAYGVGLQVGRRSQEVMVCDFLGQQIWHHEVHYAYPNPQQVIPMLQQHLQMAQQHLGDAWQRVVGVGLTAPLSMHQWADLLGPQAAQVVRQWEQVNLHRELMAMTDQPVWFAKDTLAASVAELLNGQGRRLSHYLYVFVGTFIGGALVLGGQIHSGPRGNAGAIGSLPTGMAHAAATPTAPAQLLQLASGWQLEQALVHAGHDPLCIHHESITQPCYLSCTQPWLHQASNALAMTVASASAFLDLDAVVVDGSLGRGLIEQLLQQTRDQLSDYRFEGMHLPQMVLGEVGAHARALGAAWLPLHAQFFPDTNVILKEVA